jgi:hypothetical protein
MGKRPGVALAVAAGVFVAAFVVGCNQAAPPPPPFKTLVDVKGLMSGIVDPSADAVWQSVAINITIEGEEHKKPVTDEEWTAVRNQAVTLAESGNLLMLPSRARDDDEWMKLSLQLVDVASQAVDAATAKDADKLLYVGGAIYDACVACHVKYIPPDLMPEL